MLALLRQFVEQIGTFITSFHFAVISSYQCFSLLGKDTFIFRELFLSGQKSSGLWNYICVVFDENDRNALEK